MHTPMNLVKLYSRTLRANRLSAFVAALVPCAFSGYAAVPPPEKLLPDDTLLVLTAPDFARVREIYRTSPQTQLWNDPAMKPFREKFISKLNEQLIQPLERDLGVRFDDYTNLPQGQLTVALTQNGWQGTSDPLPAVVLLLDAKDKGGQLKKNLADLRKKWVDAGKSLKTEKIRDIEFSVLPMSDRDVPQTLKKFWAPGARGDRSDESQTNKPPKNDLLIGQFDSLLIAGSSSKAVEKVVAHLTGGAMPALGNVPAFEANRLALFRDAPLYGWVNVQSFINVISRKPTDKDSDTPNPMAAMFSPDRIIAATGLGGLKTLAFAVRNSREGSSFDFFACVPETGRQGLFKLLPAEAKESGPPPFVPADAIKFQRTRIDGQKAWATLQKVMNDISPQLLSGLNFMLESANTAAKEKDPGFDINKNLFGNLGDDMIGYQKAPRGHTPADLSSAPSLFLLGSPQPEQLAAALKSVLVLFSQQAGPPTEREFLGRKIYTVPLPPMMGMPVSDPFKSTPRALSYAASGGYLALAMDPAILEEYLRSSGSQQKALRDTPGLVEAAAKVGGSGTGWFGFENQAETSRLVMEMLRKSSNASTNGTGAATAPGFPAFGGADNPFKDWLDFSLLPPFEKIAKYFYFTVYAESANADGFTLKVFAPVPPQLKK